MQDSPTALVFVAVLLPVLHTIVATFLLMRNADQKSNWNIRIHRAALGQFTVFAAATVLSAGLVAANRVIPILSTLESFLVAPVFFLLLCWLGQIRLIFYLASYRGRRSFLQPWELRRIALKTMVQLIFYYICLSLVVLGAITYGEWTRRSAEAETTKTLVAISIERQAL